MAAIALSLVVGCAQINEQHSSNTPVDKNFCGGIASFTCSKASDYCAMPVGQCRTADAAGMCKPKPQICTMDYRPVCGCDGKTYSNACAAAGAGMNVLREGSC